MIKYFPAYGIMGKQVCDSKTGRSLTKYCQLITDPKENHLKEILPGIVMNNLIHNKFSIVNINWFK